MPPVGFYRAVIATLSGRISVELESCDFEYVQLSTSMSKRIAARVVMLFFMELRFLSPAFLLVRLLRLE